jgi:ribosomal peptide maturation radical SAM protein 1
MTQLKDLKEKILSVIGGGEILLVIPPFGSIYDFALGPQLLQALGREAGYKVDLLYLNMLLASFIGVNRFEQIHDAPVFRMLGERLFSRSAFGLPPLGRHAAACTDEAMAVEGREGNPRLFYENHYFDLDEYLQTEQMCKFFIDGVVPVIAGLDYRILGCTCSMMGQTSCSIALLKGVKESAPGTVTVLGGGKCTGEMAEGIASLSPVVDYIFSGESERSFLQFLEEVSQGRLPAQRVIAGQPLSSLETLPLADYEIFFHQYDCFLGDTRREKIRIWYETSRGCWWAEKLKCTFCGENLIPYRKKSIQKVARDIKAIKTAIGDEILYMSDNIMPRSYRGELPAVLAGRDEFPALAYQLKATLDLQQLVDLKKAGVVALLPGIESFSTPLLRLMNKGTTGSQNLLFLRNVTSVGIVASWFLLWGFPGDRAVDYEEMLRLLPLIRHLQPPLFFRPMRLTRFSAYLENPQAYQITALRPWAVLSDIYPEGADLEKLTSYYTGEYSCESDHNPAIIREIASQVAIWEKTWKKTTLAMQPFMDAFAIYDNRDLHEKAKTHILDYQQAREIMTAHTDHGSGNLEWAVEEKLGVIIDSRYVPLVTASPGLLADFEKKI